MRHDQWHRNQGYRQFNEPGPQTSGGPESGAQKFYARKEYYTICGFWKDDE